MKITNKLFILSAVMFLLTGVSAFSSDDFSYITGLTPTQTEQLKRIDFAYQQQQQTLEKRIYNYKEKINLIKNDSEKSAEQKSLLIGAYERNIEILKKQQKQLEETTDKSYKSALNETQYLQLRTKQPQL